MEVKGWGCNLHRHLRVGRTRRSHLRKVTDADTVLRTTLKRDIKRNRSSSFEWVGSEHHRRYVDVGQVPIRTRPLGEEVRSRRYRFVRYPLPYLKGLWSEYGTERNRTSWIFDSNDGDHPSISPQRDTPRKEWRLILSVKILQPQRLGEKSSCYDDTFTGSTRN